MCLGQRNLHLLYQCCMLHHTGMTTHLVEFLIGGWWLCKAHWNSSDVQSRYLLSKYFQTEYKKYSDIFKLNSPL